MLLTGYGNAQSFEAITHSEIQKCFLKSELFPDNLPSVSVLEMKWKSSGNTAASQAGMTLNPLGGDLKFLTAVQ